MWRGMLSWYMLILEVCMSQFILVTPGSSVVSSVVDYSFLMSLGSTSVKCIKLTFPSQITLQGQVGTSPTKCQTSGSSPTIFKCSILSNTELTIEPNSGSFSNSFTLELGKIVNYKYAAQGSSFSANLNPSCDSFGSSITFSSPVFNAGTFSYKTVTPANYKVFEEVAYTFVLRTEHNVDLNGKLHFKFPSTSYTIKIDSNLKVQGYIGTKPSVIPYLTVAIVTDPTTFSVTGLFSSKEYIPSTDGDITIIISTIRNPNAVKTFDSITVESRNSSGELLIDSISSGLEVTLITPCDVKLQQSTSLDTYTVRQLTTYYFYAGTAFVDSVKVADLIIELTFPSTIDPVSVTCAYTFLYNASNGRCSDSGQVVTITSVGIDGAISVFSISNLKNPPTNITSGYIQFYIYDKNRNVMCKNDSYDTITATTNTPTEVTAKRPSATVGETGNYDVSFKLATELDSTANFEIRIPRNQVEIVNTSNLYSISCYYNGLATFSTCTTNNSLTDSEIILTITPSCGSTCTAGKSVTIKLTGLRNPYFADNTVTSSVKIYTFIPGSTNGYVDKVETGIKFKDDLVGKEVPAYTISRNSNIVGISSRVSMSFTPTLPYDAGFKLIVEFPEGSGYVETQAIAGESSFTSDFASKTTLTCSSTLYSTDSSIKLVTCTGASQGSSILSTIYFRLSNVVNRYDIKELSGAYKLYINTSSGFSIEYGTLTQSSSLGVFTTNTISNISITRTDNTVYNTTNIVIAFKSSTKLPASGVITITVPSGIIIQNKNQIIECYKSTTKLTCSVLSTATDGSITSLSITDYCSSSGCTSSTSYSISLRNLINPESVLAITGNIEITTNSGLFNVDTGSALVSLTLASLTSGRLFDLDIHPMNSSINQAPLYRFTFTTEHNIPANGYISITWPAQLEIESSQSITQLFGFESTSISLEKLSSTLNIRSGFPNGTTTPVLIGFYLKLFRHGSAAQTTGTFDISIKNSANNIVDQDITKTVTISSLQTSCSSTCNKCAGSSSSCYSCVIPSTAPFLYNYSCVETCPTQYFMMMNDSENLACIKCPYYCDECVSSTECTKCKFNSSTSSNYVKWGGYCLSTCPDETIKVSSTCKSNSCTSPCGECSKTDYCLSCSSTSNPILLSDTGDCYPTATNSIDNCAEGYYQDTTTSTCLKCNYVCKDCTTTAAYCTSCTTYYDKQLLDQLNNTCVKTCPVGKTIQDGLFCKACHSSCSTCINLTETGCDVCPSTGTIYKTTTGKCVANCNTENLKNYLNPTTGIYGCITSCPTTGYYDDNGTCKLCKGVCLTCNSSSTCLTCNTTGSTPYLQSSSSLCVNTCITGEYFYELNTQKECVTVCPAPTLKYSNPTSGRKECIASSSCPSTKYFINNSEFCDSCNVTCLTCGGTSATCLTCDLTGTYTYLTEEHTCVTQCLAPYDYKYITTTEKRCYKDCPANTYAYNSGTSKDCVSDCPTKTYKNGNVCSSCWSTCKECSGSTGSNCTSCDKTGTTPYLTDSGTCVASCDSTFYKLEIGTEKRCVTNCAPTYNNYLSSTEKICIVSCPSNTYQSTAKVCENCDPSCLTCIGSGADQCKTCNTSGTYPFYDSGYCKSTCGSSEYSYLLQGVLYCLDDCPAGSYKLDLISGKSCASVCPDGYYNNNGYCTVCNAACLRCTGGTNSECTACKTGYVQYSTTQCLSVCPTGYRNNNSICEINCVQSGCETCEISALDKCIDCKDGYLIYDSTCYTSCPDGSYNSSGVCKACDGLCKTCSGPTELECTSCSSELYLYINECVTVCPTGYSTTNGRCVDGCLIPCATCIEDSVTICKTCMPETPILYNQYCYSVCPTGTYQEGSTCLVCDATCKECSGPLVTNCLSCRNGYYLNPDNTCQSICPVTMLPDDTTNSCILNIPEDDSSDESSLKGYPVYILIAETGLLLLILGLSAMMKGLYTQKLANFLALMGIVEFSERIMLMVFLPYEDGPYAAVLFAVAGGFTLGSAVNAMMFLKLYFDPLIESSMTLDMFVSQHRNPFYAVYYLSMVFSVNFLRILYGGLFGIALLTVPKTLGSVKAFRVPLEKISFLKIIIINIPHLAQQIAVLAMWPVKTDSFEIAAFGLCLNVTISAAYMMDWRRSIWRKNSIV